MAVPPVTTAELASSRWRSRSRAVPAAIDPVRNVGAVFRARVPKLGGHSDVTLSGSFGRLFALCRTSTVLEGRGIPSPNQKGESDDSSGQLGQTDR